MELCIVNATQALKAAQKLIAHSQFLEERDPEESARILHVANTGMAAVTASLHDKAAPVTPAHQNAIATMLVEADGVPPHEGAARS
jgi:hypothetical protein